MMHVMLLGAENVHAGEEGPESPEDREGDGVDEDRMRSHSRAGTSSAPEPAGALIGGEPSADFAQFETLDIRALHELLQGS